MNPRNLNPKEICMMETQNGRDEMSSDFRGDQ